MQLLANLDDPPHLERYREFEDWFKHTQAIPGAFYLWIVEHLFRDNELIAGKWRSAASTSSSPGSSGR
jgi:poly(3-hydroxyalkanoate) synthetase